jgi:hypothetical protein
MNHLLRAFALSIDTVTLQTGLIAALYPTQKTPEKSQEMMGRTSVEFRFLLTSKTLCLLGPEDT